MGQVIEFVRKVSVCIVILVMASHHGLAQDHSSLVLTSKGIEAKREHPDKSPVFVKPFNGFAGKPDSSQIVSNVEIKASTGQNAWETIRAALGAEALEDPAFFGDNTGFGRHIQAMTGGGPHGQNIFRFYIHPHDTDKGIQERKRSRNEIKAAGSSPNAVKGLQNDIMRFHWWFRVASDYQVTKDDILFQLHATGGGVQAPIVKLQGNTRHSPTVLEVTHDPDNQNQGTERSLSQVAFSAIAGLWLECEVIARFNNSGYLKFTVWDPKGTRVISTERNNIDMSHGQFLRPKWGIYRVKNAGKNDYADWADISIMKLKSIP